MRIGRALACAAAAAAAACALAVQPGLATSRPVLHGDKSWAPGTQRAPAFTLRDQTGRRLSLGALKGKVVVLTFLDSHCTSLCPIEGHDLARVQRQVGASRRWQLVVVSVNPAGADTPASIRKFARRAGWLPHGWSWLTGTRSELRAVWRSYGIDVEGTSAHSSAIYLIDRRGYERTGYIYPTVAMHELMLDVRTLIRLG